jgi:hypothetical protein
MRCSKSDSRFYGTSFPSSTPKFDKFLKLPTELRLMIWEYSLPGPRTIIIMRKDVHWKQVLKRMAAEGYAEPVTGAVAITTVPAILHVSFEAREYAQNYYKLSFGDFLIYKPVYFNFDIDTLYFDGPGAVQAFLVEPRVEVRHKNVDELKHKNLDELSQIKYLGYYGAYNCMEEIVTFMTGLEKFTTMIPYFLDTPDLKRAVARVLGLFWIIAGVEGENIPKIVPANKRQLAHKKVFELTGYKPRNYKTRKIREAPWRQRILEVNLVVLKLIHLLIISNSGMYIFNKACTCT